MKLPTPIKIDNPYPGAPLAFWDGPLSVCGVCFSLNKSTSYLSLCISLNSFCNETSRTWASLNPETRCVISVGRLWVFAGCMGSSPSQAFGWVWVPALGFRVPVWGARFQYLSGEQPPPLHIYGERERDQLRDWDYKLINSLLMWL